jgi:hypothetical protein
MTDHAMSIARAIESHARDQREAGAKSADLFAQAERMKAEGFSESADYMRMTARTVERLEQEAEQAERERVRGWHCVPQGTGWIVRGAWWGGRITITCASEGHARDLCRLLCGTPARAEVIETAGEVAL